MKNGKNENPKLLYIMAGATTIPNEKAHSVQIMKMCEAFAKMGSEVELFTPNIRIDKKLSSTDPFKYYGIENKFKITRIPCLDLSSVYKYKYVKKSFYVQALSYALTATLYALRRNSDIIYTRDFYTALLLTALGKRGNLAYEIHEFPRGHIRRFLELRMAKKIHCVFISSTLKSLFERHVHGKFLVSPDGVDIGIFNKICKEDVEEVWKVLGIHNHKVIGYVGQLYTRGMEKGIGDLIDAMKDLDDCVCVLVGGPNFAIEKYKELVRMKELEGRVIFVGRIPPSAVPGYIKALDVCAMPFPWTKHYAYFMSPLKMFEYMASKKPIVATDLPTIREILDESNAVLVKPNDPEALAEGIRRVLEDEEFAKKIAEKAYEDVKQYTWEKRAEGILEFI